MLLPHSKPLQNPWTYNHFPTLINSVIQRFIKAMAGMSLLHETWILSSKDWKAGGWNCLMAHPLPRVVPALDGPQDWDSWAALTRGLSHAEWLPHSMAASGWYGLWLGSSGPQEEAASPFGLSPERHAVWFLMPRIKRKRPSPPLHCGRLWKLHNLHRSMGICFTWRLFRVDFSG